MLQLLQAMKQTSDVQQQLPECANCSKRGALTAFCPQCGGMICEDCINHHKTMRTLKQTHQATLLNEFKRENVNSYINNKSLCKEKFHEECRLEYYCKTCKNCICLKCAATEHSSHDKVSIEEAAEDAKQLIGKEKEDLDEMLVKFKRDLQLSIEYFQNIQYEVEKGKDKARCHTRAMMKILQDHENATMAVFDNKLEQEARLHEEEKRDVNASIHQITELKHQCEAMANQELEHYVLEGYENLQQVCKATVQDKPTISSRTDKLNSSIHYSPNAEVIPLMQKLKLGELVESVIDPSRCSIECLSSARCGFINEFRILTRILEGDVCHTNRGIIDIQIQDVDEENVRKEVVESQPGVFSVKYKVEKPCPYKVAVFIGGKQIKNSPQNVETIDAKAEVKPVTLVDLKEMTEPYRLAVSDREDIAVINHPKSNDSRVFLFNGDGEYLRHLEEIGEGQIGIVSAVLFNKGRLLISHIPNDGYCTIKEFAIDGTDKKTICSLNRGVGVVAMCTGNENIACLCCNECANSIESSIMLLDKHNYDHLHDIKLDVPDGLDIPCSLSRCHNKLFVTFAKESTPVYAFDENGSLLNTFGKIGKEGQSHTVGGLAMFGEEMLLVCDIGNHRVQVFNQDGQFIRFFGQMNCPVDICVLPDGRIFVLEGGNKRVQIFK